MKILGRFLRVFLRREMYASLSHSPPHILFHKNECSDGVQERFPLPYTGRKCFLVFLAGWQYWVHQKCA